MLRCFKLLRIPTSAWIFSYCCRGRGEGRRENERGRKEREIGGEGKEVGESGEKKRGIRKSKRRILHALFFRTANP